MEDTMQTKCANWEAFPIVTSTKAVEDKCSETKKGIGKITMLIRRGKKSQQKRIFLWTVFIINRFPLLYVTFSKTRQSIVRFIHKDLWKKGKEKEATDKYQKPYQNRLKRKNRENTGKLQSLPRPETKCFFFVCFLWVFSFVVPFNNWHTITSRPFSLFFKLLDRHKLRHYARIFRKILPKWHDSILSSG